MLGYRISYNKYSEIYIDRDTRRNATSPIFDSRSNDVI